MTSDVTLRDLAESDLPILFEQQLDPTANYMAAFTAEDPTDRDAFDAHWQRIRGDDAVVIKTILFDGDVAGSIAKFDRDGDPEVTYWIGKEFWGKGIATKALSAFLDDIPARPLFGRVAKDNVASIRVLEKCGFTVSGHDRGFANARGAEIDEFIMKLP